MPCRLHHRLDGPPEAPVLVLSGSLGTDLSMWDPVAAQLAGRFRTLRYDLRGHGQSGVPPGPYAMSDLGEDLLALIDELEIERAGLCGLSIGGMISMWIAANAPERVSRLVVCCTSAYLGPDAGYGGRAVAVRRDGIEPLADAVLERWFTPRFARERPEIVQDMRARLCATPAEGYAGCCEAIDGMDLRGALGVIRAPTLVVAGEADPATPPAHGEAIAEAVTDAELTIFPDAAHLAPVEHPEDAAALILDFLERS
jgi:3-oxoadipate enol-lactonase